MVTDLTNVVEPRVTLIAHTALVNAGRRLDDGSFEVFPALSEWMEPKGESSAETLVEFAGRSCYQSFHRPNSATAETADYIERTLFEQGHWSIAEHATATFYFTGVSRALTHELIRHRHLSFSQLSQRFVDESEANIVAPPAINEVGELALVADEAINHYERIVADLQGEGLPRKQAREAARAVLPNMTETRIVVTGNLRAWSEVIARRTAPDADAEIREVMGMVRDELHKIAPNIIKKGD